MQVHEPQEIEVWYVIPAIRKQLAVELKNIGISQVKISKLLGVTTAAISQYISGKRAKDFEFPKSIKQKIKDASKRIEEKPQNITEEMQSIISEIRNTGLLCEFHKKYSPINKGCTICID